MKHVQSRPKISNASAAMIQKNGHPVAIHERTKIIINNKQKRLKETA
jgi:hypothetical protein